MSAPSALGAAGWAFLVLAGIALPFVATAFARSEVRRSAHRPPDGALPAASASRIPLYANVLFTHALLLGGAALAADVEDVALFARPEVDLRDVAAAAATLVAVLGLGETFWRTRSPAERERLWVRQILPRTRAERRAWVLVSAGAALAEEVAYRGLFVALAAAATGSVLVAAAASAAAFAAVHAPQGLVGVGYVFVIAVLHQALVFVTDTLALAIAVHFAYDVLAGLWLARRHGLVTAAGCGLRAAD